MKHKIKRLLSLLLSLMMLTAALPTSIWAEETEFAQATGAEAELPNEPEATAEPELPVESPEATSEPELPSEPTKLPSEIETPEGTAEPTPQVTEAPCQRPNLKQHIRRACSFSSRKTRACFRMWMKRRMR